MLLGSRPDVARARHAGSAGGAFPFRGSPMSARSAARRGRCAGAGGLIEAALAAAPGPAAIFGKKLRLRHANPPFAALFGLAAKALAGRPAATLPAPLGPRLAEFLRLARDGRAREADLEAGDRLFHARVTAVGRRRPRLLVALYAAAQEGALPPASLGEQYRALADAVPGKLEAWNLETGARWFNRAWADYVGTPAEALAGTSYSGYIHPQDIAHVQAATAAGLAAAAPFSVEYRVRRHDGEYRWQLTEFSPVSTPGGELRAWVASTADVHERRLAMEAARQGEERHRAVTDAVAALVVETDSQGRPLLFNRRFYEYTGLSEDEALEAGWRYAVHPDDTGRLAPAPEALTRGEWETEFRVRRADGEYRWHLARRIPEYGADGAVRAWIGTAVDIHERKLAEQATRQSEQLFRRIGDGLPLLLSVSDASWRIIYTNAYWKQYTGIDSSFDDIRSRAAIYHPDDLPTIAALAQRGPGTEPVEMEYRIRRRDGQYRWHWSRAIPLRDAEGGIELWVGVIIDVHDVRMAAEALRQSEERLRVFADHLPVLAWANTPDGRPLFMNETLVHYHGIPLDRAGAGQWVEIFHPADLPRLREARERGLRDVTAYGGEFRFRRKDGEYRWHDLRVAPHFDREGNLAGWFGTASDIHDRRLAAEELERLHAEVAEREAYLQAVFEAIPVGVVVAEAPSGRVIKWNRRHLELVHDEAPPTASSIAEYTADGSRLRGFAADGHPLPAAEWPLARAVRNGEVVRDEVVRLERADGTRTITSVSAGPVRDAQGRLIAGVAAAVDITAQRAAQEERERLVAQLAAEQARLAAVFEQMPAGVMILDAETGTVMMNPRVQRIWRRPSPAVAPARELATWNGYDLDGRLLEGDDWPLSRALHTGQAVRDQVVEIERGDGTRGRISINAAPVRDAAGAVIASIATFSDVTEQEAAREALLASEERYRSLVAATTSIVWTAGGHGRFVDHQAEWERYSGQPWESHRDFGWTQALHPDDRDRVFAALGEAARTRSTYDTETLLWHAPTSAFRYVRLSAVPVLGEGGAIREWIGTIEDIHEQRKAEEALRLSEGRYRALTETLPGIVWTADAHGENDYLNPAWEQYTGIPPTPANNDLWKQVVHPDDWVALMEAWREACATGQPFTNQNRLRGADGVFRWFLSRAVPICDAAGTVQSWFGVSTEIHAQKLEAEREQLLAEVSRLLAESLDFRQTLERVAACAVPYLGDLCFVDIIDELGVADRVAAAAGDPSFAELVSKAMEVGPRAGTDNPVARVLASGRPEVVTRDLQGRIDALMEDELSRELSRKTATQAYLALPLRAHGRVVGALTFVSLDPARTYSDGQVALAEEIADRAALAVTNARLFAETRAAAEELRAGEERYRGLVEATPANVSLHDAAGIVLYRNHHLAAFLGQAAAHDLESEWAERAHADDLSALLERWHEARETGKGFQAEYRLRDALGDYRWHIGQVVPLPGGPGRDRQWLSTAIDIHQVKLAQEALVRANAMKDEFLGLVSHELRTPLTGILGNAQVLLRHSAEVDQTTREASLEDIRREAERLQRLVENMLVLAGIEGHAQLNPEPVLVQRIVPHIVAAHRARFPGREIHVDLPADLPPVTAEPTYFDQVLANLLSNAEKYSPPATAIEVAASRRDAQVEIRVLDRGAGVNAGELDDVFRPFFRAARTAAHVQGAGLGLAVCKRLVEAQGGTIWARPREGGGSEFAFALPAEG